MKIIAFFVTLICSILITCLFPFVAVGLAVGLAAYTTFLGLGNLAVKGFGEQGDNWRGFCDCIRGIWEDIK